MTATEPLEFAYGHLPARCSVCGAMFQCPLINTVHPTNGMVISRRIDRWDWDLHMETHRQEGKA